VIESNGTLGGQVETYLENGKLFGRVTQVRPGRKNTDVCDKCSGEYKNHLILGLVILRNFQAEGDDWVDGTAVDPENGKEYKGKVWAVGNDTLQMRGFIGISLFGRTETWKRMPCSAGLAAASTAICRRMDVLPGHGIYDCPRGFVLVFMR